MSMDGYDDMAGLSGYLSEFSMVGNLPTSLGAAATPAKAEPVARKTPYIPVLEVGGARFVLSLPVAGRGGA